MLRVPGFIDIGTEISDGNWQKVSDRALRSGYTSLLAVSGGGRVYTQKADVYLALEEPSQTAVCDYANLAVITPDNIQTINDWADEVPAAFVDFSIFENAGSFAKMQMLSRLFNRWPTEKPICVRGNEDQIGSAIFMGQVHNRKIHICSVTGRSEIEMITEAKQNGIRITCDIHPLSLLFSSESAGSAGMMKKLGTEDDRLSLWQHFSGIDCFSSAGYIGSRGNNGDALSVMMPLLFSMLNAEMITKEDILLRCCLNPARIFGITLDRETVIEIDENEIISGHAGHTGVRLIKVHGQAVPDQGPQGSPDRIRAARIKGFSV